MWPPMVDEDEMYMLKPMNCPSHMTLYNTQMHSYRELPLRYAEFATLYRYEKSGELSGLTRVRALTQDDCHVFCTPDQIQEEFGRALAVIREVMGAYGFSDYYVRLSLRDPSDDKYVQDDERWSRAEQALQDALDASGMSYVPAIGEAAFYGPKADFMARDALGREWQLSTIQVDFIQPARLGCEYIGEDGAAHTPVMLHRAVTGSTERFLAMLIEHYGGAFPTWLAPVQAIVIPIADRHVDFARSRRVAAEGCRHPRPGGRPLGTDERQDPPRADAEDTVHAGRGRQRDRSGRRRGAPPRRRKFGCVARGRRRRTDLRRDRDEAVVTEVLAQALLRHDLRP